MNDLNSKHKRDIGGEWHHFDADGKILGRLATQISHLLMGKHRVDYAANVELPVYIVVTNTDAVVLTGKKEEQKKYYRYSGYPGGLRERSVAEQRKRDSRKIVHRAVAGMLPKNSLRDRRMSHLKLYATAEHPHVAQLSGVESTELEKK